MPLIGDLSPFDPGEKIPMSMDFSAAVPTGDTVTSITSVSFAAYQGVDSSASALLSGAAGRTGNVVTQMIGPGGLPGVTYRLTMTVTTSSGAIISNYAHAYCAPVI